MNERPFDDRDTPQPSDTALVAAFQARELAEDVRTRAISSLRWACDDYDFAVGQAGDLGGTELNLWDYTLR